MIYEKTTFAELCGVRSAFQTCLLIYVSECAKHKIDSTVVLNSPLGPDRSLNPHSGKGNDISICLEYKVLLRKYFDVIF